jgi:PAS domain S-box-containing protein
MDLFYSPLEPTSGEPLHTHYFVQTLLEHIQEGIFCYDHGLKIIRWNQAMEQMMGLPEQTILGQHILDVFPLLRASDQLPAFTQVLTGKQGLVLDAVFLPTQRGKQNSLQAQLLALPTAQGEVRAGLCLLQPIPPPQLEPLLEESAHFVQQVMEALPQYIGVYDVITDQVVYANQRLEMLLGFPLKAELRYGTRLIEQVIHPEDAFKANQFRAQLPALPQGEVRQTELRVRDAHQEWRWFCLEATLFKHTPSGEPCQIICTVTDITERKKAEVELLEQKDFNQKVSDSLPNVIVYINDLLSKQNVYINQNIQQLLGYPVEMIQHQPFEVVLGLIHPEDLPSVLARIKDLPQAQDGEIIPIDFRLRNAQGAYRSIRSKGTVFKRTPEGSAWQIINVAEDVTELLQQEDELAHKQALLEETETLAHIGSWERDLRMDSLLGSKQLTLLFGLPPQEPLGLATFYNQILPEDRPVLEQLYQQLIQLPNQPIYHECRIRLAGGTVRYLLGYARSETDATGTVVRMKGYLQDVSQLKQAERSLSRALEKLQEAQLLAGLASWSLELATQTYEWSAECCQILGLAEGTRLTLAESNQFLHPQDIDRVVELMRKAMEEKTSFISEHRIVRPSGEERWARVYGKAQVDEEGNLVAFTGLGQDITEQQENMLALERTKAELEASNQALERKVAERTRSLQEKNQQLTRVNLELDTFKYAASHDLRSPLNQLEALVGLLSPHTVANQEASQLLGFMQQSLHRFKATLDSLAEVVSLQEATGEGLSEVSLVELIEEVQQDLQGLLTESAAVLQVNLQVKRLRYPQKDLRSILFNLLSNAVKYRSPERQPLVRVSTRQESEEWIVLAVEDNGLGMSPSQQQGLFGLFQRRHNHVEGTGVGLYLLKRIVEQAGGNLGVESRLGEGSTFFVYLPCKP